MQNPTTHNVISYACIEQMKNTNILASLVAAQAIHESGMFSRSHLPITNNLFNTLATAKFSTWTGKCYYPDTQEVYETLNDVPQDFKYRCLRVYSSYDESIEDHFAYLLGDRKSVNGPLRYKNLPGTTDIHKAINIVIRGGYMKDHLKTYNDPSYESVLITYIENLSLDKWDKPSDVYVVMDNEGNEKFKTKDVEDGKVYTNLFKDTKLLSTKEDKIVHDPWHLEPGDNMYRVKLDRNSDSIFASKILADAKNKAARHPGYKVFDEKELLVFDPHIKSTSKTRSVEHAVPAIKEAVQYKIGNLVTLTSTPIYSSASSNSPMLVLSGSFYVYDGKKYNNRIRISRTNDPKKINGKDPSCILGYIDI